MNAIKSISACALPAYVKSRFNAKTGKMAVPRRASCKSVGDWWLMANAANAANLANESGKVESTLKRACDRIQTAARNSIDTAGNLPDSEVFSRQEFAVTGFPVSHSFGRDAQSGNACGMAVSMFLTSRPPVARRKAASGLQSHTGAETMTTVNTTTTPKAAPLGITPATFPGSVQRQIAIETALADALHFIRLPYSDKTLNAATARARRALSMLKQACAEASQCIHAKVEGGCHDL